MVILGLCLGLLFALVILVDTVYRALPTGEVNCKKLLLEMLGAFLAGLSLTLILSGALHT